MTESLARMRQILLATVFAVMVTCLVSVVSPRSAMADDIVSDKAWKVTYTSAGKMEDDYSYQEYVDQVSQLQPGDTITFSVSCVHENKDSADWYMQNEVVKTLEEASPVMDAKFGAYTYVLTWEGPSGSRVLYKSDTVGGDVADGGSEGLSEATDALNADEYIFLERMGKGDSGKVTLKVGLDGETEGNAYFDTLAKLRVRFAVEPVTDGGTSESDKPKTSSSTSTRNASLVRTGDDTRLFPYYVSMFVSGTLLVLLGIWERRDRRRESEGSHHA